MSDDSTLNLSDHYVELLERVIEENRLLREDIRNQGKNHEKALSEFSSKLNELAGSSTPETSKSRKTRRKSQKITVPQPCRQAYRVIYNKLIKGGNFEGYKLTESYGAKENQVVVEKVVQAVESDNGGQEKCPWTPAQLKAAGASYFKTKRDAHTRAQKNETEEHRRTCRKQGRMREKLQRRLEVLERAECTAEKKEQYREAMTIAYTSSDESDLSEDEDGQLQMKGYLVKKFPWERTCLKSVKQTLDRLYVEGLPPRSRLSLLPRRIHTMASTRSPPENPLRWAVREAGPIKTSTPL